MTIGRLLQIKEFREDRAQQEVRRARRTLEEADRAVQEADQRLREHRADCARREQEIYAHLCTRVVRLTEIRDAALQVDLFKQGIKDREAEVEQARTRRQAMATCLEQAQKVLSAAISAREKFTQLREMTVAELLVEQARAEDAELEEVPARRDPTAEEEAA